MRQKRTMDDFIGMGSAKTASAPSTRSNDGESLLSKLAADLADNRSAIMSAANQSVANADPEVVAAMFAASDAAQALAGGRPDIQDFGHNPSQTNPRSVIVGDGTGSIDEDLAVVNDIINSAGVNNVSTGVSGMGPEKVASLVDAVKVGRAMARGYQDELAVMSKQASYDEAVAVLSETGILDGYQILGQESTKVASEAVGTPCLDKIAYNTALTVDDIIGAADEFLKIATAYHAEQTEKTASDEAQAGEALVEEVAKIASELAAEIIASYSVADDGMKVASDDDIVDAAYVTLVNAGIINP